MAFLHGYAEPGHSHMGRSGGQPGALRGVNPDHGRGQEAQGEAGLEGNG